MAFLVATTSLPAVYRPNGYARTTIAGTPHARAKMFCIIHCESPCICCYFISCYYACALHKKGKQLLNSDLIEISVVLDCSSKEEWH